MKRFLIRIGMFVLVFNLISILSQKAIFFVMHHIDTGDLGVANAINSGRINAEMLFSGSSRAYVQYNPEIFNRALGISSYNIGINGSGLEVQLAVLRWYLDNNEPPLYLVQNIDIFGGESVHNIYQPFRYLPYLNNRSLFEALSRIDRRLWVHRLFPISNLFYFNKDFQKVIIKELYRTFISEKDYLNKGYADRGRRRIDRRYEEIFLRDHSEGIRYSISEEIEAYLNDLVILCRERGILLFFVMAPEYVTFMNIQINRKEILDYYTQFCQANGVYFIDYSESDICMKRDYFYNFTHLNSDGATSFSEDLAEKLRKAIPEK